MSAARGLLATIALLTAVSVAGIWMPGWAYLPVNLGVMGVLALVALRAGATRADLGIERARLWRGLLIGGVAALVLVGLIAVGALIPGLRGLYEDERAAGIAIGGLLYQVLLRIPVGTALFEEFAFRGVLLGLGRKVLGSRTGAALSAGLFGLWHVVPAATFSHANAAADELARWLVVVLAMLGTAGAGFVFNRLRDHSGSLAAPVIVHAAINAAAFTAAWLIL